MATWVPSPSNILSNENYVPTRSTKSQEDDNDTTADFCLVGATGLLEPFPFINPDSPLLGIAEFGGYLLGRMPCRRL